MHLWPLDPDCSDPHPDLMVASVLVRGLAGLSYDPDLLWNLLPWPAATNAHRETILSDMEESFCHVIDCLICFAVPLIAVNSVCIVLLLLFGWREVRDDWTNRSAVEGTITIASGTFQKKFGPLRFNATCQPDNECFHVISQINLFMKILGLFSNGTAQ